MRPRAETPYAMIDRLLIAAVLVVLWAAQQAYALGVTAEVETNELRVGDTLTVTVTGSRIESQGDPEFVGANIQATTHWTRGGQAAHSPLAEGDKITKKQLADINFPSGALVGAVLHEDQLVIPKGDTQIKPGDKVVVFSTPDALDEVEKLFEKK